MAKFDYFVVFAEMRTGSNFLEASLNEFDDLVCYGEAFNPHFVGHHNKSELFGLDLVQRETSPIALIERMKEQTDGLPGFRFFNDHDPRVMAYVLNDPKCAKIVLTRNPLDSYVSLKIAGQTGQWKLSDVKQRRSATITFSDAEFRDHLEAKQAFQLDILKALQTTGQTAFYVAYEDIHDVDVLNGLARWLGSSHQIASASKSTKRQNPSGIEEKVINFDEMRASLASIDHFGLDRTPNFEPRRGPRVPGFRVGRELPILFMPIHCALDEGIAVWLEDAAGGAHTGWSQKELRQWMRQNRNHRSFCVLRHPLARAHTAFCRNIVPKRDGSYADPRRVLRNRYNVAVPNTNELDQYTKTVHHNAFCSFLKFLKGNLAGQTSVRIDQSWASQSAVLDGMVQAVVPDMLIRAESAAADLSELLKRFGVTGPAFPGEPADTPYALSEIYDDELEKLCFAAYRRDYINFGFEAWTP